MDIEKTIRRKDIYCAELYGTGNQQTGYKPVIVISNEYNNTHSSIVNVIPLTSSMKELCVHVLIEGCGLDYPSMALTEQITTINKTQLKHKIGTLSDAYMKQIEYAIDVQLGKEKYVKEEAPF